MDLKGKKVLALIENTYHEIGYWYPVMRLREAGAEVTVAGPEAGTEYKGYNNSPPSVKAEISIRDANVEEYDAVVIPGGRAPDRLMVNPEVNELVKKFHDADKVIGSVCHAGWVLASAGIAKDRRIAGNPEIQKFVEEKGGVFTGTDAEVDGKIVSCVSWTAMPEFCQGLLDVLSKEPAATLSS